MPSRPHNPRAGFTLLELMLALVLLSILFAKAYGAMTAAANATSTATREVVLEDQARRVLRQIGYSVMGSNRETLIPDAQAPLSTEDLKFQVNLGIQDGVVVWSDSEQVAMQEAKHQVYWSQNPDAENERRVVWTSLVAPYLEGELPNGMDDNGNGLIDEKGLSFVVDRNAITIRLTLERVLDGGEVVVKTVETTVTCRNLPEPGL